ncbi:MAG: insulinase family protein [Salibacteraceae bacterium]
MKTNLLPIALISSLMLSFGCDNKKSDGDKNKSKYVYETVENDPFGLRVYTLNNGLKVYISQNKAEPRIQTNIAVKTGSKQDPSDATGLAHYLEHMVFKGTSKIGSLNWEEEKKYLQMISDLYEDHRTAAAEERTAIYSKIDSLSQIAASFVSANEYDKLISGIGAERTNAYTSFERTVYINDIPSTELEKWLKIESERFNELVLRLFHTELEAVYEEFNRTQDSDGRQAYYKTLDLLFPTHPYGQQTTIGTGEHLKSPSMQKIHDYFSSRYVPNNMAIILAGDLDPEKTIAMIDKYFGSMERKALEPVDMPREAPITEPKIADVMGSEAEFEMVAFRLDGAGSKDALYLELMDGILSNGTAGLIDLNLNQSQKVLRAYSNPSINEDYSWLIMNGQPREGQELEDVRTLLLAQIDSIKKGHFEDWMIDAVVRKYKKDLMSRMEYNSARAYLISNAFILGEDWSSMVNKYDEMAKISKESMIQWVNETFNDNYVAVNKRIGEKDVHKVEKPAITPVEINREENSDFFTSVDTMESMRLEPQFIDYEKTIQKSRIGKKVDMNYVKNELNELYSLYYVLDFGSNHDKTLALAVEYLPYLGTEDISPSEVQKELFKLGVSFDVFASDDKVYVRLNGLQETFQEGVTLFENILKNVVQDQSSYDEMVQGILKKRMDKKLSKAQILFNGMRSYGQYGSKNPFNDVLSKSEMDTTDPSKLVEYLHNLTNYEHRILFYGPQELNKVVSILEKSHDLPEKFIATPEEKKYEEISTDNNKVYFCEYDMVQAELMMMHRGNLFNKDIMAQSKIFNEYFGSGLSSIVFQEIRESKALAYASYAAYVAPSKADEHHYVRGYIGTQVNKLDDATSALLDLMSNLPKAEKQFQQAKLSALKQIETNRTTGTSILWSYERAQDLGLDYDLNKEVYPVIQEISFDDVQSFFDEHIKGKTYTYMVIGKKEEVDMNALEKLGPVTELSLEEVFGY